LKLKQTWTVYIISAKNGKLYSGITTDLDRRLKEHKSGKGAKFFRTSPPKKVVYRESCKGKSKALRREIEIKKLSRKRKMLLIAK